MQVIVALDAAAFGAWEAKQFAPVADFRAAVKVRGRGGGGARGCASEVVVVSAYARVQLCMRLNLTHIIILLQFGMRIYIHIYIHTLPLS